MIFAILFIVIVILVAKQSKKEALRKNFKAKQCPPHDWHWEDIYDDTGELQGNRLMCKNCGPFSDLYNKV